MIPGNVNVFASRNTGNTICRFKMGYQIFFYNLHENIGTVIQYILKLIVETYI